MMDLLSVGLRARLSRLWRKATAWFGVRPWRLAGTVEEADEVPTRIPVHRAFLVGIHPHYKWLVFDCPCTAGHRIMLNLDPSRRPYWTLRLSRRQRITISPSIDYRHRDRSCHYFIRDGRLVWASRPRHGLRYLRRT